MILYWVQFLGTAASGSDAPVIAAMVTFPLTTRACRTPYIPHAFYKRPEDTWLVGLDCGEVLPVNTRLVTVEARAVNSTLPAPAPEVLGVAQIPIVGEIARVTVQAGSVGITYRVKAQIECDDTPQTVFTEQFTMTIVEPLLN